MPFKNYRDESRAGWGVELAEGKTIDQEQIKLGAVLRIADAMEKMTAKYDALVNDRDYYKRTVELMRGTAAYRDKVIAGLRSEITKMKKRGSKGVSR